MVSVEDYLTLVTETYDSWQKRFAGLHRLRLFKQLHEARKQANRLIHWNDRRGRRRQSGRTAVKRANIQQKETPEDPGKRNNKDCVWRKKMVIEKRCSKVIDL